MLMALVVTLIVATMLATSAQADDTYVVQAGDTLGEIAEKTGVSQQAIMQANNLTNADKIYVGQKLIIPRPAQTPSAPKSTETPGSRPATATAAPASPTATTGPTSTATATPTPKPLPASKVSVRSVLAKKRVVSYYGHPNSKLMGVLGELDTPTLIQRLKQVGKSYEQADTSKQVIPAIELITVVAQQYPGDDGKYRARVAPETIEKYSRLAQENGMILILDVQVGLSTVRSEIDPLIPYLKQPHVHLALDPEFDMWPGQKPGQQLGHMTAYEINYAQYVLRWIADDVDSQNKILLVHQFTGSMLPDKKDIEIDPRVDLTVVMDGFGSRGVKEKHYDMYVREEGILFGGIKHFFKHDVELMTPADTMQLNPQPDVIIYQ
jgi:LysM repeat protein